jgi:hypothetical protein
MAVEATASYLAIIPHPGGYSMPPSPPIVLLAVRIPKDLHRRLKIHVAEQETSMAAFVAAAIEAQLAKPRRARA